jgi:hypothetical protein
MVAAVVSLFVLLLIGLAVGILVALLVVPITICGTIAYSRTPSVDLRTRWGALGFSVAPGKETEVTAMLCGRRILTRRIKAAEGVPAEVRPEAEVPAVTEKEKKGPSVVEVIRKVRAAWPHLQPPLLTGIRSIRLEYLTCSLRIGFNDPAMTGEAYGYFWALKGMLSPIDRLCLEMTPAFDREVVEGTTDLCIAIRRPLVIIFACAKAFTKKPVRDLLTLGVR